MTGQSPWFVDETTYDKQIKIKLGDLPDGWKEGDPDDREELTETVTLRLMNAGDKTDLEDQIRMEIGDEAAEPEMRLGSMRQKTVEMALVDWSLPMAVSAAAIRKLQPDAFEQIFKWCTFTGKVPADDPTPAAAPPPKPERTPTPEPVAPAAV